MALHTIALCAGVGMLDEGLRAGCEFLGIDSKTVCYVEREAFAAATLVKHMEAGAVDAAPIWSDLVTFDGAAWRGRVDCITAGFPCQPHSVAGKRKGTDDERWLWQEIARIIRDVSPRFVFLENVRGLLSSGGFTPVITALVTLGFDVEWGVLAASKVGASHQRERIFILAYRDRLRQQQPHRTNSKIQRRAINSSQGMGDTHGDGLQAWGQSSRSPAQHALHRSSGGSLADTGCVQPAKGYDQDQSAASAQCSHKSNDRSANSSNQLAHTIDIRLRSGRSTDSEHVRPIIDTDRQQLFAPSPRSDDWSGIIANQPHLAPATEPDVCLLADGLAYMVDASRADQIRACGNGVVPLQAAAAFVALVQRAGI